ncbi:hypothetical protein [Flagellimonas lutimaris]|uniref:hypothetical protein n=1 Tax=Flagellimonas lutimaris TaxID=475082 RepID=UPI003F5CD60E
MKNCIPILLFTATSTLLGQTNNFPSNGNVTINDGHLIQTGASNFMSTQGPIKIKNYLLLDSDGDFTGGNYFTIQDDPTGNFLRLGYGFANNLTISPSGNVGINTNSPSSKLDVNGILKSQALSISGYNPISSVNGFRNKIEVFGSNGAIVFNPGLSDELMFGMHSNGNFYWGTGGANASNPNYYSMYLNGNNGNLGIRGKLTSNEVMVKVGGWADYVFEEGYDLPTLEEVEKHIKEKGHLINIPSAKEVEENGIQLGEMNKRLLEKIEELTLYILEQEERLKEMNKLKMTVARQEKRLKKLEQLLNHK